jgi:hypothetical protein
MMWGDDDMIMWYDDVIYGLDDFKMMMIDWLIDAVNDIRHQIVTMYPFMTNNYYNMEFLGVQLERNTKLCNNLKFSSDLYHVEWLMLQRGDDDDAGCLINNKESWTIACYQSKC